VRVAWRKVWRDLWLNKARTVLVVLSIAVSVFAVGTIVGAYGIMNASMDRDRLAWVPIHASFWGWFRQEAAKDAVLRDPDVVEAERLIDTMVRWRLEDDANLGSSDWRDGYLYAREDYEDMRLGILRLVDGDWPEKRVLAVERMSAAHFGIPVNTTVTIQMGSREHQVKIGGIVRDPGVTFIPQFGGDAVFYATPETATWLSEESYNRIDVRIRDHSIERTDAAAERLEERWDAMGVPSWGIWVRDPDEHWFQESLDTLLIIMTISGALLLALSIFLIVNTLSAVIAQQVWQIGVMKAVGATRGRVAGIYLMVALIYGGLALPLAIPSAALCAYWLAEWGVNFANVPLESFQVMPPAIVIQILLALSIPVLAALVPVLGGVRITAHEAISSYGLGGGFGQGLLDRLIGHLRCLPRPLALSLRNTFRHKVRVVLTLLTLALGGAMFMSVMSVQLSCDATVEAMIDDFGNDLTVWFNDWYRVERLLNVTKNVPGVAQVEVWKRWGTRMALASGEERYISLLSLPPESEIVTPRIVEGRPLLLEDEHAILLSYQIADEEGIGVGDEITIDLGDNETTWTVVGIVANAENASLVPFDALSRETESLHYGWYVAMVFDDHSPALYRQVIRDLRKVYATNRLEVSSFWSAEDERASTWNQFTPILYILLMMALLAAVVGSIGLMGTMSINVVERTREIGVMRATGATSAAIAGVFVTEGVLLGVLSWLIAVPFSHPGGRLFSDLVGQTMHLPFDYSYSAVGVVVWLVIVIVLSTLASLWPALRATRVSVREALAYE
jgi:putative ABC transport system permease protein